MNKLRKFLFRISAETCLKMDYFARNPPNHELLGDPPTPVGFKDKRMCKDLTPVGLLPNVMVMHYSAYRQWRWDYFWTGEVKSGTPNWWDLYRIWSQKEAFAKKKVFADFRLRLFGSQYSSQGRGAQVVQGWPKYFQLPSSPPTSRAYAIEAYWSNAMFKCDILRSIFRAAPCSSGRNARTKAAECCRIFGFEFLSRQFIINALS